MRKSLTAAMAAVTLGGAICATAPAADAAPIGHGYGHGGYYHGGYYRGGGGNGGAAIAAGVVGLALGAALASNHGGYGGGHGYYASGPAYYPGGYYYGGPPAYAICDGSHWVWDPYMRRNVLVRSTYAC